MKVIILRGPSGSGKSTFHEKHYPDAWVCSADSFFVQTAYKFDARQLPKAHAHCMDLFLSGIEQKAPLIIVDNTNCQLCGTST